MSNMGKVTSVIVIICFIISSNYGLAQSGAFNEQAKFYEYAFHYAQENNVKDLLYNQYMYHPNNKPLSDVMAPTLTETLCFGHNGPVNSCVRNVDKITSSYLAELKSKYKPFTDAEIKKQFDDLTLQINTTRDTFNSELRNNIDPENYKLAKDYKSAVSNFLHGIQGQALVKEYYTNLTIVSKLNYVSRFVMADNGFIFTGLRDEYYVDPIKAAEDMQTKSNVDTRYVPTPYGVVATVDAEQNGKDFFYQKAPTISEHMKLSIKRSWNPNGKVDVTEGINNLIDKIQEGVKTHGRELSEEYSLYLKNKDKDYNALVRSSAKILMTYPNLKNDEKYKALSAGAKVSIDIKTKDVLQDAKEKEHMQEMLGMVGLIAGGIMLATGILSWLGSGVIGMTVTTLAIIQGINIAAMVVATTAGYMGAIEYYSVKKELQTRITYGNIDAETLVKMSATEQALAIQVIMTVVLVPLDFMIVGDVVGFARAMSKGGRYLEAFLVLGKGTAKSSEILLKKLSINFNMSSDESYRLISYLVASKKSPQEIMVLLDDTKFIDKIDRNILKKPLNKKYIKDFSKLFEPPANSNVAITSTHEQKPIKQTAQAKENVTVNKTPELTTKITNEEKTLAKAAENKAQWTEEAKQGLHNDTPSGRQIYDVEQKAKANPVKEKEVQKALDEMDPNKYLNYSARSSNVQISLQGKQINITPPNTPYGSFKNINQSSIMKKILTESTDIIKQKTGIEIGTDLTLDQQKVLIKTIREDIIPKYASDRSKVIFSEDGTRDYKEYAKIAREMMLREDIRDFTQALGQTLLEKGGICGPLSSYNPLLLRLYNVKAYYTDVETIYESHAVAEVVLKDGSNWILDSNLNGGYFLPKNNYLGLKTADGKNIILSEPKPWLDVVPDIKPQYKNTLRI